MAARSWRVAGPFGSQQQFPNLFGSDRATGAGYRQQAGTPNPLIGSVTGHTIIITLVALQDFGVGFGNALALESGDFGVITTDGGYLFALTPNISVDGMDFLIGQGNGVSIDTLIAPIGNKFFPKRGNGIIVTYNWDAVAGVIKAKTSIDSLSVSLPVAAPFLPFIGAGITDYAFSVGHVNSSVFGTDFATTHPTFGVANIYYSTTKTQWTDPEIVAFEDEIKAIMATDSALPIPDGTTESDWTVFDSRDVAVGAGSSAWKSRNGVYSLRSDLFADPYKGNNEFQQLRTINFPSFEP